MRWGYHQILSCDRTRYPRSTYPDRFLGQPEPIEPWRELNADLDVQYDPQFFNGRDTSYVPLFWMEDRSGKRFNLLTISHDQFKKLMLCGFETAAIKFGEDCRVVDARAKRHRIFDASEPDRKFSPIKRLL